MGKGIRPSVWFVALRKLLDYGLFCVFLRAAQTAYNDFQMRTNPPAFRAVRHRAIE